MEPEQPGAAIFCLESEPTQFGRSRSQSRLRDLGTSGAAQKSGGSATLVHVQQIGIQMTFFCLVFQPLFLPFLAGRIPYEKIFCKDFNVLVLRLQTMAVDTVTLHLLNLDKMFIFFFYCQ